MKITINNLTKKFKDEIVLNNINMTLESGNIYGIIGQNGSGKSVLLKIICAFYIPSQGEVLIDNINYCNGKNFPKNLRALIEKNAFLPDISGFNNLKLLAKIENKITDEEINESLKIVNLYEEKDKMFSKYSMGMKQKLGIASALMEDPEIIILDEPFNGIDEESKEKITNELIKIKNNKIIIITSHIKAEITSLCDHVFEMKNGKIINEK
ncbi:aBC-type multidrug transport system ATPase component [Clostridium sp. CAG:609]|nr:aBC-type multidrug transport system ATPase component [Clostridium sp. CAG:609]